jgi:hypothetical protein
MPHVLRPPGKTTEVLSVPPPFSDRNSVGFLSTRDFPDDTACRVSHDWVNWDDCPAVFAGRTTALPPMRPPVHHPRNRSPWLGLLVAGCVSCALAVANVAADPPSDPASVPTLVAAARRAGLRVLEGDHLSLATDRPLREGDGVEDLPRIFDAAFASWCVHYGIDPATCRDWRAFGCLVVDRERFRAAGLLPDAIPDFANGFCDRDRFWMLDQSNPAYRRHLLLHEGVHAFTLTLRSLATPPWYSEGIAEFLATHRMRPPGAPSGDDTGANGSTGGSFEPTPMPPRATDVEQLGRIESLRALRSAGESPTLQEVFDTPAAVHHDLKSYAASWAAVVLLARHPAHAEGFAAAERGPLDGSFTTRLAKAAGWDASRAARDFAAFTDDIDYGYDFARSAIDWSPGTPLTAGRRIDVAADRGWQNAGVSLEPNQRCTVAVRGRVTIGEVRRPAGDAATPLESEADGISLRWYRGRPIGRLLAAQWIEPGGGRPGHFAVLAEGSRATCAATTAGPLFLKINEPPGDLADNAGTLTVALEPAP